MATRTKPGKLTACRCSTFEVGTTTDGPDGTEPEVTIETTGCDRETTRLFAQGHDAKLTSFLVRAELEGKEVRYGRGEGVLVTSDAVGACRSISDALAAKAAGALAAHQAKAARRAEAKAKKAARPEPAPEPQAIKAKVGRWVREGTVEGDVFTYADKGGQRVEVPAGKWAEVTD